MITKLLKASSILYATLLILPFLTLNTIAVNEIEPFFSFFKISIDRLWEFPVGNMAFIISLLLLLAAGFVLVLPWAKKELENKRILYILNTILAIVIFSFFILVTVEFTKEVYRCEIQKIANCD